jgi:hypothetical protein
VSEIPRNQNKVNTCPICSYESEIDEKAWFYTCKGCGSGINLIGIWWKQKMGENWLELSQDMKMKISKEFYGKRRDWKKEVLEI